MRVGSTCPTLRSKRASWRVAHLAARLHPTRAVTRPPRPRGAHSRRQYPARTLTFSRLSDTRGPRWRNGGPAKSSRPRSATTQPHQTGLVSRAALPRQIGLHFADTPGLPTDDELVHAA